MDKKSIAIWILVFLGIRLLIMPFSFHGDISFINRYPSKLFSERVIDIYKYDSMHREGRSPSDYSYYPPLTYFTLGLFHSLFLACDIPLGKTFETVTRHNIKQWISSKKTANRFRIALLCAKSPYLLFDLLCFLALFFTINGDFERNKLIKIWCFNPVVLYSTYAVGQVDILPAAMTALSLLFACKRKYLLSFSFILAAFLYKSYPVFLFPVFFLIFSSDIKTLSGISFIAIFTFLLVAVPYYLSSGSLVTVSFFPQVFTGDNVIFVYIKRSLSCFLLALIYLKAFKLRNTDDKFRSLLTLSTAVILVTYSSLWSVSTHYFQWVLPGLILCCSFGIISWKKYWALIILLFVFNLNAQNTTFRMLTPINTIFYDIPGLPDIMHRFNIRWGAVMLLAHIAFTGLCLLIAMDITGLLKINIKPKRSV